MKELGHDHPDLLKMDIEGAQHVVIESLVHDRVLPAVLCVEFDQPALLSDTRRSLRLLRGAGYALVKGEGFNMTFVRADQLA